MLLVSEPTIGEVEQQALADVIRSNWITMGDRVLDFERQFARAHGANNGVAVGSCTAALHLILAGLGVGPGDEVLVPSLSFVATANCILYVGAVPVFVDIESIERPHISLAHAIELCTAQTKAVIVMDYGGWLVDGAGWSAFAASRDLLLIDDAAHAAGIEGAGLIGDAGAFSFYGNKNLTTAEGGMVLARDPELLERVRRMRSHGMTSGTRERLDTRTPSYDVTMLGWNYRLDELRAAMGLAQLQKLGAWIGKRRQLVRLYHSVLRDRCPEVLVPFLGTDLRSAYHIMPVVLPAGRDRERIMDRMRRAGVQTTIHYPPIHTLSFYRSRCPTHLPVTETFASRELTLPLHPKMEESDVKTVVDALVDALAKA